MTEELNAATPAEQVAPAEQDAQVEHQSAEATTEQTQEQQTDQQAEQKREPWFQKRIGELTREKYEARRVAEEAQRERDAIRAYVEQIQQGQQEPEGQQPQAKPPVDIDTLATQKAQQLLAEQSFNERCNKVYSSGKSEFQDFDQAVANLQMVGVNREFLDLATSSDVGPKLLHHLGTDLDEAARILSLPPVQMARELTRLEFKLSQPVAKPVSKAPAPINPIGSKAAADSNDLRDDLPIEEWMRRDAARRRK